MQQNTNSSLSCLFVVTMQGTDALQLRQPIQELARASPCTHFSVLSVCKAPDSSKKPQWRCVKKGDSSVCSRKAPAAPVIRGCNIVLPDTGQECHGLLHTYAAATQTSTSCVAISKGGAHACSWARWLAG
jgi:hypothetical protein